MRPTIPSSAPWPDLGAEDHPAPARRRRCAPRHPAGGRNRQARRQGHPPQRLRRRPQRNAPEHRRKRRLRTRPTEDRERDLQRARDRRVQPGARFRTRAPGPGRHAGGARPAGLRRTYRLRPGRSRPATRTPNPGARKRLFGRIRTHAVHAVFPAWAGPVAAPSPPSSRPTPPSTSKTTPANVNGAPNRQCTSHNGNCWGNRHRLDNRSDP